MGLVGNISAIPFCRRKGSASIYPSGIVAAYKTYGKTNESPDKNVLKDLSGNNHDIQLMNFAWAGNSGYGLYSHNFNSFGYSNLNIITQTHTSSQLQLKVPYPANGNIYSPAYPVGYIYDFKIKVTGLKAGCTITVIRGTKHEAIVTITQDGVYNIKATVEEYWDQKRIYIFIANLTSGTDNNITIEQIPDYQGGLVFDGIDDYGICDNFPILTKEKGYTVLVLRKWLNIDKPLQCLLSNRVTATASAFVLESRDSNMWYTRSFSNSLVKIDTPVNNLVTYQTTTEYNGRPILIPADNTGSNILTFGKIYDSASYFGNFVLYATEIYNRVLSTEEIEQVKTRMLNEWLANAFSPLALDYQALWTCNGKTNNDADKNVPNLVDSTNPIIPSNFAWKLNSGYGLYTQDYKQLISYIGTTSTPPSRAIGSMNSNSFNIVKIITFQNFIESNQNTTIQSYKIRITGLTPGKALRYGFSGQYMSFSDDGIYQLPTLTGQYIGYNITGATPEEDINITVEQIPEGEGLYLDGVDDVIASLSQLSILNKYSVVGDFSIISRGSKGIGKASNWYIYQSYVFINASSSVGQTFVADAIGFTSSGLILTKNTSLVTDKIGDSFSSTSVRSSVNCEMAFHSLAVIPYELTETQMRQVYDYLKTIKANNLEPIGTAISYDNSVITYNNTIINYGI